MKHVIGLMVAGVLLAGCTPDVVDGFDLRLAYKICIGVDNDLIANRVACTQAVYGGVK